MGVDGHAHRTARGVPAHGVTRLVVGATATEPDQQRDEMSAFAQRFGLLDHLPR
jgi:hypothetical protein